jgi:hypothetical protein
LKPAPFVVTHISAPDASVLLRYTCTEIVICRFAVLYELPYRPYF